MSVHSRNGAVVATALAVASLGLGVLGGQPRAAAADVSSTAPDSVDWQLQHPATSAPATAAAQLVYDTKRERMVLFGGFDEDYTLGTWMWDGSTWKELNTGSSPSPRYWQGMAYDPVRDEIVMFGGMDDEGALDDTWLFKDDEWTRVFPATSPPANYDMTMAFDPNLQQVVAFGGNGVSSSATWTWDGETWAELHPADVPRGRSSSELAYDPQRHALVLFGGESARNGKYLGDTWSWDGTNWTKEVLERSPVSRIGHVMATFGRHVVMVGGYTPRPNLHGHNTWKLKGDTWRRLKVEARPQPLGSAVMAFDESRDEAVLFGGITDFGTKSDETWTLRRG